MGSRCTSTACEKSTKHHCGDNNEAEREAIFRNFCEDMTWEEKKIYVHGLIDVLSVQRRRGSEASRQSSTLFFFFPLFYKSMAREGGFANGCSCLPQL